MFFRATEISLGVCLIMVDVVKLSYFNPAIAVVAMEDREHGNTFSKCLVKELLGIFQKIKSDSNVHVVVIHGYDNYFCCGGTKEELLNLQAQKGTFADSDFYRVLLDCDVPVIAAMQGHALGGGLALACYADTMIMAEECLYSANFMKYGFTPGMGATYVIPRKFGLTLGHEMLYTAENYSGLALKYRGISPLVVKKKNVIETALSLAEKISEKPLISLKLLKQHLSQEMKSELPRVVEQEIKMHAITFSQAEVKNRIEERFGN